MELRLFEGDARGLVDLDPRTKLFLLIVSSATALNAFRPVPLLVLGTALCGVVALCGRKMLALKALCALTVGVYLRHMIEVGGPGAAGAAVSALLTIGLFCFPAALSVILITQTTRPSHLMAALAALRLPASLVIAMTVFFRFIPTVQDEWNGIRKAMAFRGVTLSLTAVARAPLRTIEYTLVPLLFSSISVMEELASASLARGMDSARARTSYAVVRLRAVDYAVVAVFLALAGYIILYGKTGV